MARGLLVLPLVRSDHLIPNKSTILPDIYGTAMDRSFHKGSTRDPGGPDLARRHKMLQSLAKEISDGIKALYGAHIEAIEGCVCSV